MGIHSNMKTPDSGPNYKDKVRSPETLGPARFSEGPPTVPRPFEQKYALNRRTRSPLCTQV